MRQKHDQLAKRILEQALQKVGTVSRQHEVSPDALYVDLWFIPDPEAAAERGRLGLLGEMVSEPCLLEAFSRPPGLAQLYGCLEKQLALRRHLHGTKSGHKPPMLWMLSAGKPVTLFSRLGFTSMPDMPSGLYQQQEASQVVVVVISELPQTRTTLALRLLGARRVRQRALEDLAKLPRKSREAALFIPMIVRLCFEIDRIDRKLTAEEEALLMSSQQTFEEFCQQKVDEGIQIGQQNVDQAHRQGVEQGIERGTEQGIELAMLASDRLARPLTTTELRGLLVQLGELGADRAGERLRELSPEQLPQWLDGAVPE